MKQTEFNREDNALPVIYNPKDFQPIRMYLLTRYQTHFLIKVEKYIAGLNILSAMDEVYLDSKLIKLVISRRRYDYYEIPSLLKITENYKFLYENKR
jgi:hypothetical protein